MGHSPIPGQDPVWTFLTNQFHVLVCLHQDPDLRLRDVAERVGITERAVQRILHELEQAGFVSHTRVGRRNSYEIRADLPLRHPLESHLSVGDLLELINTMARAGGND